MIFFEPDVSKCDITKKKYIYNILVFENKILFIILNLKKKKENWVAKWVPQDKIDHLAVEYLCHNGWKEELIAGMFFFNFFWKKHLNVKLRLVLSCRLMML